jgi:hypothetical protein
MTSSSWLDQEPTAWAALAQIGKLIASGFERRAILVAATLVYAAALAVGVAWSRSAYEPECVLRVVEGERETPGLPPPRRQLAEYVRRAVFTSAPLGEVLERHGLYPNLARSDPRAALDAFREDIQVDVRQNYFIEERPAGTPPRSARLVIRYRNADPEVAVAVTRALGELVAKHELTARGDEARRAAEHARARAELAREALTERRVELAAMGVELEHERTPSPRTRVAYIGLLGSLPALERREETSEHEEATLALDASLEQRGAGRSFEIVSDPSLPSGSALRRRLALAGGAFVLGLPLLAVAVGAFAPKRRSS